MAIGAMVGATVISGVIQSREAKKGRKSQERENRLARQERKSALQRTLDIQAPWREAGEKALKEQQRMLSSDYDISELQNTPGYKFAVEEGTKGMERSQAARGLTASGRGLKGMERFRQNLANRTFNQRLSQLGALSAGSGVGQAGQAIMQTGAGLSALHQQAGQNEMNYRQQRGSQLSGLISQGAGIFGAQQGGAFNKPQGIGGNYYGGGRVAPGGSFGGNDGSFDQFSTF